MEVSQPNNTSSPASTYANPAADEPTISCIGTAKIVVESSEQLLSETVKVTSKIPAVV